MVEIRITDERLSQPDVIILIMMMNMADTRELSMMLSFQIMMSCLWEANEERYLTDAEIRSHLSNINEDQVAKYLDQGNEQIEEMTRLIPFQEFMNSKEL